MLAARAKQAFHEWVPVPPGPIYRKLSFGPLLDLFIIDMRTYKDPNDSNVYADPTRGMLGHEQREWLIRGLTHSKATWKVIANDLPLGLVVPDAPRTAIGDFTPFWGSCPARPTRGRSGRRWCSLVDLGRMVRQNGQPGHHSS